MINLLRLGLNRLLIPLYGPIMAAITNLIASLFMFGLTLMLAKRNYYIRINFPLLLGAVAFVAACYAMDIFIENVLLAFVIKVLFFALTSLVVVKTGLIDVTQVKAVVDKMAGPVLRMLKIR